MAKTFDISRVVPGTIELVRDSSGNYTTKVVGLETINSLSLPDLSTVAAVTKTDTDADNKTASELTEDTVQSQTQAAFKMPQSDRDSVMATGDMLTEAKKTSEALANVTTPTTIQDNKITDTRLTAQEAAPQEDILTIKDPTEKVFKQSTDDIDYVDAIRRGETGVKFVEKPKLGDDLFKPGPAFDDKGTPFTDAAARAAMTSDAAMRGDVMTQQEIPDRNRGEVGISTAKPAKTALDMDRFEGVSKMGTLADKDVKDVKPVKRNALETVSTSLRSAFKNIKTPTMMLLDAVVGEPTAVQNHDKQYFTDRGDGRIGGNPSKDLYAGMNRVSMFGNLEKAGASRISNREKTIERRGIKSASNPNGVSQEFVNNTNNMKDQQEAYSRSLDKKTSSKREAGSMNQPGRGGDQSGRSGGKIVCTMMNESYGFGSFRNKIWLRHSKNLAPEYQIGYHRIFLPLVKKAKTNKVLKKILEHIAIHRTIDIRQQEKNKIHLLGRVYRTILEPICYWVGKV